MTVQDFYDYCKYLKCEDYELTFSKDFYVGFVPVEPEGTDKYIYGEAHIKHDSKEVRLF